MPTPTRSQLAWQLRALRKTRLFALLEAAAAAHGLELSFVLAIGSRESNLRNLLGDKRNGEYHGVGLMQIDVQHEIARAARDNGSWRTHPAALIDYGAAILAHNLAAVRAALPGYTDEQVRRVACSAYNCGLGPAIAESLQGNSDALTTDKDYGHDCAARYAIFKELLARG